MNVNDQCLRFPKGLFVILGPLSLDFSSCGYQSYRLLSKTLLEREERSNYQWFQDLVARPGTYESDLGFLLGCNFIAMGVIRVVRA